MLRTSERIDEVMAALAAARPRFPAIRRNKTVTVRRRDDGTYTFTDATLDTILDAVCPVLGAHGLALVCGVAAEDGAVRVTTRLAHASGQWVETTLAVPQPATLQELGSCLTYLKRYAINAVLAIEGETDDDATLADGHEIVASAERAQGELAPDGDAPPPTVIPADAGLPCGGQGIGQLTPPQLTMLIGKVARLAEAKGGQWAALLAALQAERATPMARPRRPTLTSRDPPGTARARGRGGVPEQAAACQVTRGGLLLVKEHARRPRRLTQTICHTKRGKTCPPMTASPRASCSDSHTASSPGIDRGPRGCRAIWCRASLIAASTSG
jgi:hypothetical protein